MYILYYLHFGDCLRAPNLPVRVLYDIWQINNDRNCRLSPGGRKKKGGGGVSTNSRLSPRPAFQTGRKNCSFDILFPFAGKHVTFERSPLFRFAASAEQILQLLPASITLLSPLWISCMHSWLCVCVCVPPGERGERHAKISAYYRRLPPPRGWKKSCEGRGGGSSGMKISTFLNICSENYWRSKRLRFFSTSGKKLFSFVSKTTLNW